jgi:poly(A) polymerase
VRFASRFSFSIERKTWEAICEHAPLIASVSPERIREELTKILTGPNAGKAFRFLRRSGLLRAVLPEVDALWGVEQPRAFHPEGDVFEHTCRMLDLLKKPGEVLAWSALLHDSGKPATFHRAKDRIRFHGHNRVGANLAGSVCERLRFSNDACKKIYECIDNHMNFMHVKEMRPSTLKRLLRRATFMDEIELHRLDCLASHGDLSNWRFLEKRRKELKDDQIRPAPLVTGMDLIQSGFQPGPIFKRILHEVETLQLEGRLQNKEQALLWVRTNFERG